MKRGLQILLILLLSSIVAFQLYRVFNSRQISVVVCPVGAITMDKGKAVIDATKCIGCRRCVDGIPVPLSRNEAAQPEPDSIKNSAVIMTEIPQPPVASPAPIKAITDKKVTEPLTQKPKTPSHTVDSGKCIGCTLCVPFCPVEAITMVDGKAVIDKEKCINCGICVKGNGVDFIGCPVSAITFE